MASRCALRSGHLWLKKAALSLLVLTLALGAQAQTGGALPPLPAVQDEGTADPAPPAAAPAPAEAAEEEEAPVETPIPPGRFSSEADARASLRAAFASHDYSAVLGMVEDVRKQFPNASFARYYETMARLQMRDRSTEPGKLPYKRLESIPPSEVRSAATPAPAPQAAATVAPVATPAAALPPVATPESTPEPTPSITPAQASTRSGATKAAHTWEWLDDLLNTVQENSLYLAAIGGGVMVLALLTWFVRRRRRAAEEEEAEADLFAMTGAAPRTEPDPIFGGMMLAEDEAPAPPPAAPVFRTEVQAQALAGGALAYGPSRPLAGLNAEVEDPAPASQSGPLFSFAEVEALQAERVPERPLRAAPADPDPLPDLAPAAADPIFEDSEISFDEFIMPEVSEPEPPQRPAHAAPSPREDDDSLLVLADQPHDFPEESVGESLYIDGISKFEFPTFESLGAPAAPEQPLSPFALGAAGSGLTLDSPGLGALDTRPEQAHTEPSPDFSRFGRDEVALAGEETQTGSFGMASADETLVSPEPGDPFAAPPAPPATPDFTAFRADETVMVSIPAEPAPRPDERTMLPPLAENKTEDKQSEEKRGKAWIVERQSEPEDVFEREYRQGVSDAEALNWVGAIHHLSIAAALRPSAMEVKEKLREARRMRAKELEGRG